MNFSDTDVRTLECHPDSRHDAVTAPICARAGWKTGALELSYGVKGDLAALRIPAPAPSRRTDDLWQHTCFEVFILPGNDTRYLEMNFSPSGEWAAYSFCRYRERESQMPMVVPQIHCRRSSDILEVSVAVDLTPWVRAPNDPFRIGIASVIEDRAGRLSYWALQHGLGKPDFHDTETFALVLAPRTAENCARTA